MPSPNESVGNDAALMRGAALYAKLLATSIIAMCVNIYCQLFGPAWQWVWIFCVVGFVLSLVVFSSPKSNLGARFQRTCPLGLAEKYQRFQALQVPLGRIVTLVGACLIVAIAIAFICARGDGVPSDSLPAFAKRETYRLVNHGTITEVSRIRFAGAAAGGLVAWHAGAILACLTALHMILFGKMPPFAGRGR